MSLLVRNDEQIQVGVTPGLDAGETSFVFDGTDGKPDYRGYDIVISEISGTGILIRDVEYSWEQETGTFNLLELDAEFAPLQWYNVHFQNILSVPSVVPGTIIDPSFFIRDIMLPNTGDEKIIEKINLFINKYEPKCLKEILGYPLYKVLLNETSTRINELIYGGEYTDDCGLLTEWQGLVHLDRISLIANYIFYYIQEYDASQTTGLSTKISKTESGVSISPAEKMINAWNFFSSETKSMAKFLWSKKDIDGVRIYPEFTNSQFFETLRISRPINLFGI